MLFVSESVIEARRGLVSQLAQGKINAEQAFRQALELDPEDHQALLTLAAIREKAGDLAAAEDFCWRALRAQPCYAMSYLKLAHLLEKQPTLARGLAELGIEKALREPDVLPAVQIEELPFLQKLAGSDASFIAGVAEQLRELRQDEPDGVRARLRPFRLIHSLQKCGELMESQVDAVVREGASIVPLLIGVIRGWARDVLEEDELYPAANAMALAGEIGDMSAIPALMEFVNHEDANLSGPAGWGLNRIVERNPEAASRVFREIAPQLDAQDRIVILMRTMLFELPDSKDVLLRVCENLESLETEDLDAMFPSVISASILVLNPEGVEFARSLMRRHGSLLSRKGRRNCDELIEEFAGLRIPPRPPAEPLKWTIYDVCGEKVDWEAEAEEESELEEEDDDYIPEPVVREFRPGRNDPCWCGSGKKYKKCHLDSDEAQARERG